MSFEDNFSASYDEARQRFRGGAQDAGAVLSSHPLDVKGPDGQELTIDVACLGDTQARNAVIISSGLHGVEGPLGSAVQQAWYQEQHLTRRKNTRLILVHALNPFGYVHGRRWNEQNVDLNRNFVHDWGFRESDPEYQRCCELYSSLNAFLNPPRAPSRWEPFRKIEALRKIWLAGRVAPESSESNSHARAAWNVPARLKAGVRQIQNTVPVGQYEYPRGLFFGGREPQQTTRIVRDQLAVWVGEASQVVHLDFHTGLGKYGKVKLLLDSPEGSERERLAQKMFGNPRVETPSGPTAYQARGGMLTDCARQLAGRCYLGLTAEFGTYSGVRVIGALRAENQAHHFDQPGTAAYERAKREVKEVFCPASTTWRRKTIGTSLELIQQALETVEQTIADGRACRSSRE